MSLATPRSPGVPLAIDFMALDLNSCQIVNDECVFDGRFDSSSELCLLLQTHSITYQGLLFTSGIWLGHSELVLLLLMHVVILICR
jgi:hypothetical protein